MAMYTTHRYVVMILNSRIKLIETHNAVVDSLKYIRCVLLCTMYVLCHMHKPGEMYVTRVTSFEGSVSKAHVTYCNATFI
jgi:hypothetical protein